MKKFPNIYLIGPMGAGKTSVGQQLAHLMNRQFYDSDIEIEFKTGVTIGWIFEIENEKGFRLREAKMIEELTKKSNIVLATGGGCILTEANRTILKATGSVIYLRVPLKEQLKRALMRPGVRPLLNVANPELKLQQLNEEREPLYLATANFVYETDKYSPRELAKIILRDLNNEP